MKVGTTNGYRATEPYENETFATRSSFVKRLRDWNDQMTWNQFFGIYGQIILSTARRAGLEPQEAEDVVQETILSVAKKMPDFVYDRSRCSLGGWVRHVAELRIIDQFRRRRNREIQVAHPVDESEMASPHPFGGAVGLGESESVDAEWQEAWKQHVLAMAMGRLQLKVSPEHFQIFHALAVDGKTAPQTARLLGVRVTQVYVVRHRLTRLLTREVQRLSSHTPGQAMVV
jgi:RNA polymerase sigma factor (sigma-70 family)